MSRDKIHIDTKRFASRIRFVHVHAYYSLIKIFRCLCVKILQFYSHHTCFSLHNEPILKQNIDIHEHITTNTFLSAHWWSIFNRKKLPNHGMRFKYDYDMTLRIQPYHCFYRRIFYRAP